MGLHDYKKLTVWQDAIELVNSIYDITTLFPDSERFILVQQILRAAISIPSNIAEGAGRNSNKDFAHFVSIATGSCYELETQLLIAYRRNYIAEEKYTTLDNDLTSLAKRLYALRRSLEG